MESTVVNGIQFTSGDADSSRDPMVFSLYGCNADGSVCKTLVANGRSGLSEVRNVAGNAQNFRNTTKFATIKILFVSLRNTWTDAMQVAEVSLFGTATQGGALVPILGTVTKTPTGFDVPITNFDGRLNWSGEGDAAVAVSIGSDGIDLSPAILRGETLGPRSFYWPFPGYGGQQAVREGDWKLVRCDLEKLAKTSQIQQLDGWQLYDLAKDPKETIDVAAGHPDVVARLSKYAYKQHTPNSDFPLPGMD
jgi:hypothetical protein